MLKTLEDLEMLIKRKFHLVLLSVIIIFNSCSQTLVQKLDDTGQMNKTRVVIGENVATNSDFENSTEYWYSSGTDGAVFIETNGRSGNRLTHYYNGNYTATTSQTITGLENGIYKLKLYSVGGNSDSAYMFARDFGNNELRTEIDAAEWGNWTAFSIDNISITNGECTIGLYTENSEWISIDDFSLELVELDSINNGTSGDAIDILASHGFNYARIRILVDPPGNYALNQDLDYVIATALEAKANGMKILLDFFYSDWWCDPGQNWKPESWSGNLNSLQNRVYDYTTEVLTAMDNAGVLPDMVQIGNEINDGMCWEPGQISINGWSDFISLTNSGKSAVKNFSQDISILIQYAGTGQDAIDWFSRFSQNGGYMDVLGISFYEMWHGDISVVVNTLNSLGSYNKDLYIIETAAYWKTSEGNESTSYSQTEDGQYNFLYDLTKAIENIDHVKGLFYWGATWTQANKWLVAPYWSDDDAGCRGLFNDNARVNRGVDAIVDAGGLPVIGVDVSEAHYAQNNGVNYLDL